MASRRIKLAITFLTFNGLTENVCFAQVHPDHARYEYLFMNGNFVAPYTTFPSGRDRGLWKCYDGKTKITFDCTFVRGGFDQFQFIFRAR
jgi:hypothetical protein